MSTQSQGTGGDVDCFAGDAILIVYETEKNWERIGEETRARIEGPSGEPVSKLTLATMVASQCGGRLLNRLSPYFFSGGGTDATLTLHGSIGAGSVCAVNIGGSVAQVSTPLARGFVDNCKKMYSLVKSQTFGVETL